MNRILEPAECGWQGRICCAWYAVPVVESRRSVEFKGNSNITANGSIRVEEFRIMLVFESCSGTERSPERSAISRSVTDKERSDEDARGQYRRIESTFCSAAGEAVRILPKCDAPPRVTGW